MPNVSGLPEQPLVEPEDPPAASPAASVDVCSDTPVTPLTARRRSMTVATALCDGVQPASVIDGAVPFVPSPCEPLKLVSVVLLGRARAMRVRTSGQS